MFASALFKTRPAVAAGKALFAAAAGQSREPAFYLAMGAPDTIPGRFELLTLHVAMAVLRLKGLGPQAQETVQALFDAYLDNLDVGLREYGVGDLSMGKKMKRLGQAFYGRVQAYEGATSPEELAPVIARTVYEATSDSDPKPLAAYAARAIADLVQQTDERLLAGEIQWPKP